MNNELKNIPEWFKANKLSLNISKTKYAFFHANRPLGLPKLIITNTNIERKPVIKFLGVLLDEAISWNYHINAIKSKI